MHYSIDDYDYLLPERLIAQEPAHPRDSSRLMVVDRARRTIEHHVFSELPNFLDANDVLVANNTKVIKARLLGKRLLPDGKVGGNVEFVMLEEKGPLSWEGLFKASAKYVAGLRFQIPTPDGKGLVGELVRGSAESPNGTVVARFDRDPMTSGAGEVPLPSYIERRSADDVHDYQTIFAKHAGSAAAPTAGLHFTNSVHENLQAKGVGWQEVTLHVGLGTFRPVKESDIRRHIMHEERYEISPQTAEAITYAKHAGKRILSVGTTSTRTLESAWKDGVVQAGANRTSIFIYPGGHRFQVVDRLLTNFHLPKSTLLMLVSAFADRELILNAYAEAVKREYRFFSYGDAMLIL